jgi:hypothetical protein
LLRSISLRRKIGKIDKMVLEEIVAQEGNCLKHSLCTLCPFRSTCLPDFLVPTKVPPREKRLERALDALMHDALFQDNEQDTSEKP